MGSFTQRFTKRARQVVAEAVGAAEVQGGDVRPAHLLAAIVADPDSLATRVLLDRGVHPERLLGELARRQSSYVAGLGRDDAEALAAIGIDLDQVLRRLEGPRPRLRRRWWEGRFAPASKKALELSLREAIALRHNYIGTEHLLLGLARGDDAVVSDALVASGVTHEELRDAVRDAVRRAG